MNVKIIERQGKKAGQPYDMSGAGTVWGIVPYENKVTGKSDPIVEFPSGRFLHAETIIRNNGSIINIETGQEWHPET